MNIREAIKRTADFLSPSVGEDEARAMAKIILEEIKGYSAVELAIYADRQLLPETESRIQKIAERVVEGEPLQYILGSAHFHGRNFKVTSDTLIPRPETSQLIDIIVKQNFSRSDLRILDIGTGSGCIAISLALDLPFSKVEAIDISKPALLVASQNAEKLKAKVKFSYANILEELPDVSYDIIVSNPPYVMEKERAQMDPRVVEYEPSSALFVPDNNPLLFYKLIMKFAKLSFFKNYDLNRNKRCAGILYLEINPLCKAQLSSLFHSDGWDVETLRDYKGNYRFMICRLTK